MAALQAYFQAFFEEEEKRLTPILEAGLENAKKISKGLNLQDLLQELSQGVRFEEPIKAKEVLIAPAYWTTPLLFMEEINSDCMLFLFGARPDDMSAIPGELVPEVLLRSLKALADPTRLKILHYLSKEELTPSELARRLHLRAPTVTHHLGELRVSGLVNLTLKGQEKLYRLRKETVDAMCLNIKGFLEI
jgi:DNA-binding transcriptional ArsR family regulator